MNNVRPLRPEMLQIGPGDIKLIAGILVIVLAIFGVASQVQIVREDEYRVIRSWTGQVNRIIINAGPALKLPFLESAESLPRAKRMYDGNPNEILTSDQKPIIVDHYAIWHITDPLMFVQNTQSLAQAEQRIDAALYSTVRAALGRMRYGEIVSEGQSARGNLTEEITRIINESLTAGRHGITVQDVRLKRTDLPDQNLQSVYVRMKSDRGKIAADYLAQGEELAIKVRAETDREVAQMVSEARREAQEIEAGAEREAARIYNDAYGADPEFYSLFRTLESYRTTLAGKPAIVLPIDSPYARLLMGR